MPGTVGVIGGGAAGISAVMWLKSLHVPFEWWAGSAALGGMLHNVNNPIANLPPARYENGRELATHLQASCASFRAHRSDVDSVEIAADGFLISAGGESSTVDALIVATGTRYRRLGVPGEAEGIGRWVSQSAARDADRFAGRPVMVVGGGDAAFENAIRLAKVGAEVKMACRSARFRARKAYIGEVEGHERISILPIPTQIVGIEGKEDGCIVTCDTAGERVTHEVACVFVRIGVEPVVPKLPDAVSLDERGFVIVDRHGQSDVAGLFAAGDVSTTILRSVATSVGDGARCARSAAEFVGAFFDTY